MGSRLAHLQAPVTRTKCQVVVKQFRVHNAGLRIGEFADVTTEEDWKTGFQHPYGGTLHSLHIDVYVRYRSVSTYHVPEAVYSEMGEILVAWVIDQTEKVVDIRAR